MGPQPNRGIGKQHRPLLQRDIEAAIAVTTSNAEAARYLHVSFDCYKKYAKMYGLYEKHINRGGKGVSRKKFKGTYGLNDILEGKHPNYSLKRLKARVIASGILEEACALCGYDKKRVLDNRCPLSLICLDGDSHNHRLENLQLRCYNCFDGKEQYMTQDGLKTFEDTVGTTQIVLNGKQEWVPAEIKSFGVQPLQLVEFKPSINVLGKTRTKIRHSVVCTPNHRWFTNRGETTNLQVGDIVPQSSYVTTKFIPEAWIRGFGYGAGTIGSYGRAQVRLCGKKDSQWMKVFRDYGNCSISFSPSYKGDALVMFRKGHMTDWKQLPLTMDADYLSNWLQGYLHADGSYNPRDGYKLASQNVSALEFVKQIAPYCGYIVTGGHTFKSLATNFGKRKAPLSTITLRRGMFIVSSIIPLTDTREVYCVVEPQTHAFTLANGILTGNCYYHTMGTVIESDVNVGTTDHDILESGQLTMEDIEAMQNELMRDDE